MKPHKQPNKTILAQLALGVADIIDELGWLGFSRPTGQGLSQEVLPGLEGAGEYASLGVEGPNQDEDEGGDEADEGPPTYEREDIEVGIDRLISRMIKEKLVDTDKVGRQPTLRRVFRIVYEEPHPILDLVASFERHVRGYFGTIEYAEMQSAFEDILKIEHLVKKDLRKANA